jgi:hypothetical protein
MGWYLRKSFGSGPFRLNVSKSGLGVSVGVRGARISVGPRGTYFHGGVGGLYYRQKLGNARRAEHPTSPMTQPTTGEIVTADAGSLTDTGTKALLAELNIRYQKLSICKLVACLGIIIASPVALLTPGDGPVKWVCLGFIVITTIICCAIGARIDVERKTMTLQFDLEDSSRERFLSWEQALSDLGRCARIWRIQRQSHTDDWKRNAGASQLVSRTTVRLDKCLPPYLLSNVTPYCLSLGSQMLYFFPDRLLVYERNTIGGVSYDSLEIGRNTTTFSEDNGVPADARVVGYTWRFVNKDGGPDRRFNNNRQIPKCLYGELSLRSGSGLNILLQTSQSQAPEAVKAALEQMRGLHAVAEFMYEQRPAKPKPPQDAPGKPPGEPRIAVSCPSCGSRYQVRPTNAGRNAKCRCGHVFPIPLGG